MEPLVRASLATRRILRRGYGLVLLAVLSGYLVSGGSRASGLFAVAAGALWLALLVRAFVRKLVTTGDAPLFVDVEVGALLTLGLDTLLLRTEGTLAGRFSPAIYVLVALVAAFARPLAGLVVVGYVVALEALLLHFSPEARVASDLWVHAAFVGAFALLNVAFLRAEVARIRLRAKAEVEGELDRLKEDARSYRLLGAGEGRDESAEERLERSSVEEIHQSVHYALELLRRTLGLHTVALLWRNDAGTHYRISELSSAADDVQDAPIAVKEGIFAVVAARKETVTFQDLKPSYKVPYYTGPCPIRAIAALPILSEPRDGADGREDGRDRRDLRGVLVLDRVENRPFTEQEQELAGQAARYCLRAIENERVFLHLERAKVEQGKLYRAAQALGGALSEKEVVLAGVRAAREIASFDVAAVTVWDDKKRIHEVVAMETDIAELQTLTGATFSHNGGLVSMVVENRFPLPYKGEFDASHQVVFSKRFPWPAHGSLLILPLIVHDRVMGTIVLGARRRHAFGESVRSTLEVLASHLAVSLANARMVKKLEELATTDGLTGLLNKRAMFDAADQKIAAAARFGRPLSVLVTDIDFFKRVNDTYGHDVGDHVIKGLGEILKRQKRNTDVVARFGGEEFVALCEQTDEKGALLLAERIREELKRTVFESAGGPISVTCSIGVATFPDGGRDWDGLFKAADEALYASKRNGRDRVTQYKDRARQGASSSGSAVSSPASTKVASAKALEPASNTKLPAPAPSARALSARAQISAPLRPTVSKPRLAK